MKGLFAGYERSYEARMRLRVSAIMLAVLGCFFAVYVPFLLAILGVLLFRILAGYPMPQDTPRVMSVSLAACTVTALLAFLCIRAGAALLALRRWAAYVTMVFGLFLFSFCGNLAYDFYHPHHAVPDEEFGGLFVPFCVVFGLWWWVYLNLPHDRAPMKAEPKADAGFLRENDNQNDKINTNEIPPLRLRWHNSGKVTGMAVVKIVECPRDAWQGLPGAVPAEVKAEYLRVLIAAGFRAIDAVSFVSPAAVPQMADSEKVLDYLDPPVYDPISKSGVEIIGIAVNEKGAERAVKTGAVSTLGFPYSVSPTFLKKNQNQTPEEAVEALEAVGTAGYKAGLEMVAYVSMAFGNPYGDAWDIDETVAACDLLMESGVRQISLADTVGVASAGLVGQVVKAVMRAVDGLEVGVHLHARPEEAAAKVRAAYGAGCRRFDGALGGYGGCPLAQDVLVGNVATEAMLAELKRLGAEIPKLTPLDGLLSASREIARRFGAGAETVQ